MSKSGEAQATCCVPTDKAARRGQGRRGVFVEELTALGCGIALDDFGTDCGSFTYLKHLQTNYLKIRCARRAARLPPGVRRRLRAR